MTETTQRGIFCSDVSLQNDEQQFATAPHVGVWLLLEFAGAWPARAVEEAPLPAHIREYLNAQSRIMPHARVQLIKRPAPHGLHVAFYVAVAREVDPVLYEFHLPAYEDLLALDVGAMVAGDSRYAAYVRRAPIFLVCAHATRDQCCARYGAPVYSTLARRPDLTTWQTTHLGGHRFAANVLCLPDGTLYGRARAGSIGAVIDAHMAGRLDLALYRGRSHYVEEVQAAEFFLRRQTGVIERDAFRLAGVRLLETDRWDVEFSAPREGAMHRVVVAKERGALQTLTSCRDQKESSVDQYRFVSHQIEAAVAA